jgi:hypothetical protein
MVWGLSRNQGILEMKCSAAQKNKPKRFNNGWKYAKEQMHKRSVAQAATVRNVQRMASCRRIRADDMSADASQELRMKPTHFTSRLHLKRSIKT